VLIAVDDALLVEAQDWALLGGVSMAGFLTFAVAIGVV
jgi:hypothetical protein